MAPMTCRCRKKSHRNSQILFVHSFLDRKDSFDIVSRYFATESPVTTDPAAFSREMRSFAEQNFSESPERSPNTEVRRRDRKRSSECVLTCSVRLKRSYAVYVENAATRKWNAL